jgi:threonine aldolase
VYDFEQIKKIKTWCVENDLPLHLDGARMMNSLVYTGIAPKEYAAQFDSISLCLSKGLGAPVGSLLLGTKDFIKKSRRVRKVFGGGMRQAGFIAAAGEYGLRNNVERLKKDHLNALKLEETLNAQNWVKQVVPVMTNIVVAHLVEANRRTEIIEKLAEKGIACMAFGEGMLRFVTHLDVSSTDIEQTIQAIKSIS